MRLESELHQAYGDGQLAAQKGKPQSDCPVMAGDLYIEWVKGWKAWHKDNDWWQEHGNDDLGGVAA